MAQWSSFLLLLLLFSPSIAGDTITPTSPLTDGQNITSSGGTFKLGFFSPHNSNNRYIGIWFNNIPVQTVVWVANRANPINDSTGLLTISSNGTLVLANASNTTFWSSSEPIADSGSSPVAQLLDSGNFVVSAAGWQSFDYPTDTLLAGMKLGGNLTSGLNRYLTAWESTSDPYPGEYSFKMVPRDLPEFFMYRGSTRIYASGPWNGLQFSGVPDLKSDATFTFSYVSNQDEAYYTYQINNQSVISMLMLNETGVLQRHVWLGAATGWSIFWSDPKDPCDTFAECGPFGFCNSNDSPICNCLQGFEPKSPQEWKLNYASGGCVRKTQLDCEGDGFMPMQNMKLPESTNATSYVALSLVQCREMCLKNCSCTAYASANVSGGGSGCNIWVGDLIDLQEFEDFGQDLYVRLAASDLVNLNTEKSGKNRTTVILASTASALLLLGLAGYIIWIINAKRRGRGVSLTSHNQDGPVVSLSRNYSTLGTAKDRQLDNGCSNQKDIELPLYDMATIMAATDNFLLTNKLGEGGFGPVYKGKLGDGQDIAVKRLSKTSLQGRDEFKNEVTMIARLQHRNLVRLLGCCIHGEERMLIYEFMHNRSLDTFIFDKTKSTNLDWQRRFTIILGIARGLLYLHQDSRLRIIHRDLKASNILLDTDMNPKISDFGMARIFGGNQTDAYTQKVVGTYGYMSPEYAMDGIFSMKSDVFSFGVLVLEIVSGKKNRGVFQSDPLLNLINHAWRLWKEGKSLELLDESMGSSYIACEVLRCIHVGLLCVQEQASDRPIMSYVTMMLSSESLKLQQPNEPGFIYGKHSYTKSPSSHTFNDVTVTTIDAR